MKQVFACGYVLVAFMAAVGATVRALSGDWTAVAGLVACLTVALLLAPQQWRLMFGDEPARHLNRPSEQAMRRVDAGPGSRAGEAGG